MIILNIRVPASQQALLFDRATDMCAFIAKHKLHPWEYSRADLQRPRDDWHRVNPDMKHD